MPPQKATIVASFGTVVPPNPVMTFVRPFLCVLILKLQPPYISCGSFQRNSWINNEDVHFLWNQRILMNFSVIDSHELSSSLVPRHSRSVRLGYVSSCGPTRATRAICLQMKWKKKIMDILKIRNICARLESHCIIFNFDLYQKNYIIDILFVDMVDSKYNWQYDICNDNIRDWKWKKSFKWYFNWYRI